jgi:thiamine-phosphate pyrophosphorylase
VSRVLPRLIVITDWRMPRDLLLPRAEAALALGPMVALQHRHPEAPIRLFLEEARMLAELCQKRQNPLFINGRLDVALLLGADLHLPARGLLPTDVRPHLPKDAWISISVHNAEEASAGQSADIALISPVFPVGSKVSDDRPPLGPEGFARLAGQVDCAPFALGGVTAERAAMLRGAKGYAAVSAILQSADSGRAAAEILKVASST